MVTTCLIILLGTFSEFVQLLYEISTVQSACDVFVWEHLQIEPLDALGYFKRHDIWLYIIIYEVGGGQLDASCLTSRNVMESDLHLPSLACKWPRDIPSAEMTGIMLWKRSFRE